MIAQILLLILCFNQVLSQETPGCNIQGICNLQNHILFNILKLGSYKEDIETLKEAQVKALQYFVLGTEESSLTQYQIRYG